MSTNERIKSNHLQRCAYVYVRQSTAAQVHYNRESTDRQYKLAERAVRLGWSKAQVKIIDEDLARSERLPASLLTYLGEMHRSRWSY